jgi:hypothetical protein
VTLFACCRVLVGQPGLHLGWVPHWSIGVGIHEYASRERTNQGPLLQHADYLQAHRCKFYNFSLLLTLRPNSSLKQVVVKHSRDKDLFLRVLLKCMQATQMYESELKEVNECISFLAGRLEELKAKCTEEAQLKDGTISSSHSLISLLYLSIL